MSIEESTDAKAWITRAGQIRCGSDVAVIAPGAELAKSLAETALEASLFMGSQGFVDVV